MNTDTPYNLGRSAGLKGTLKGCPYGPGWRQDAYIWGYWDTIQAATADRTTPQP